MIRKKKRRAPDDEGSPLDMTSMIDVVFLLLIFFMCATKFRLPEGSMQTHLPRNKGGPSTRQTPDTKSCRVYIVRDATNRVVVYMDDTNNIAPSRSEADRNYYEQARGLPSGPEMVWVENYIVKRQQLKPDLALVVDFEPTVPWKYVNDVINISKSLKIEDIAFVQSEIPIE